MKLFNTSGFFRFAWIIPGAILVLILAALFLGRLSRLPKNIRRGFILSALLYLGGVLLLGGLGGWRVSSVGFHDPVYDVIVTAEESLEMLGMITFTYFALKHLLAISEGNRLEMTLVDD